MATSFVHNAIEEHRLRMGSALTIVGHHYQSDNVICHADMRGDSLALARKTAQVESEHIVFCGVYFMAESSALLAGKGQKVYLPEPSAECSMALMSPAPLLRTVLEKLMAGGRKIVPLAYVNSTLAVKAVVGEYGGAVCTSANSCSMLKWAMGQGDAVLFLPDKNLGFNTAVMLDMPEQDCHVISLRGQGKNLDLAAAKRARLLLWPGSCSIHTRFGMRQLEHMRNNFPDATIAVHPECTPEVVRAADATGSTAFLIRYVENAPVGSTVVIGTEINLVERLAEQHKGRITVLPLVESACTHMAQTTEERLAACLDAVEFRGGSEFVVTIPEQDKIPARASLERMLAVCAQGQGKEGAA